MTGSERRMIHWTFAGAFAVTLAIPACNDVGSCPSSASITPGGSCSGDLLECPYTLQTPAPACDGTMVEGGLATSCVCTNGAWACPDPVSCDAGAESDGAGPDATGATDNDGGAGTDGGAANEGG